MFVLFFQQRLLHSGSLANALSIPPVKADPNAPFPGCFLHNGDPIFFLDFIILLLYNTGESLRLLDSPGRKS
jgi:hypothetical protein